MAVKRGYEAIGREINWKLLILNWYTTIELYQQI